MHRIDGLGHVNNMFVHEDVSTNRPPTEITAAWLNTVQEEIIAVIAAQNIALKKASSAQLLGALDQRYAEKGHTHSAATQAAAGLMSAADKTKLDGVEAQANKYTLPSASATVLGGIKLGSATVQTVAASAVTATASRSYAVQVNAAGQAVVNVPWVDTKTTYSAATTSAAGLMSAADKAKLDGIATQANKYTLPSASATVLGGIKLGSATVQTVAAAAPTATASRTYAVQANASGQAVVNVPWVDTNTTYTLPAATTSVVGGVKLATTAQAQAGTDASLAVTPAALAAASLGMGQTWQDMKESRSGATAYRNTTGKPIAVNIYGSWGSAWLQVSTNGTDWVNVGQPGGSGDAENVFAIVPNNHYYRMSVAGTPPYWMELR